MRNLKLEIVAVAVLAAGLIGATTISGARVFGQGLVTSTYGGVDVDSSSATIECAGEIKGPVKTEGIVADGYIRCIHHAFNFLSVPPSLKLWSGCAHAHAECHTRNCQTCIVTGLNMTSQLN